MIRHTSGIICVPMEEEQLTRLTCRRWSRSTASRTAPPSPYRSTCATAPPPGCPPGTAPPPSGRSRMAPPMLPTSPVPTYFPLRAMRRGGVLVRAGHTEAAVDLRRLAGLKPAGVLCEVMNDDGSMARRPQLQEFARPPRAQDRHHRGPHPPPAAQRALGGAVSPEHSVQTEAGEFRPLYLPGLREPGGARGARPRTPRRRALAAGARAPRRHPA